jgi:hypothetical protein
MRPNSPYSTRRSDAAAATLVGVQQHESDVILLWSVADEAIQIQHDGVQRYRRRRCQVGAQHSYQTRFPVLFGAVVFCLGHPIGEDDEPIAALQGDGSRFIKSVVLDSERNTADTPWS